MLTICDVVSREAGPEAEALEAVKITSTARRTPDAAHEAESFSKASLLCEEEEGGGEGGEDGEGEGDSFFPPGGNAIARDTTVLTMHSVEKTERMEGGG